MITMLQMLLLLLVMIMGVRCTIMRWFKLLGVAPILSVVLVVVYIVSHRSTTAFLVQVGPEQLAGRLGPTSRLHSSHSGSGAYRVP